MPDPSHSFPSKAASLVNWLVLSGVAEEIADKASMAFTTPHTESPLLATLLGGTKKESHENSTRQHSFPDLAALNTYLIETPDIGLRKTARHTVIGTGPAHPPLMVVTDTPDGDEDVSGKAFTGPGNMLIKKALHHAGFDLETLYFTYVSKWRPPGQRGLSPIELRQLRPLIEEELRLVRPRAILVLGESAFKVFYPENPSPRITYNKEIIIEKEYLSTRTPLLASQKGEFLVKNPSMKKSFWFSLLSFAEAIRAEV